MNNKFEFLIEVDDQLDGDEIEIPSMIIQPFIENAIWHGISPMEGNGEITIRFKKNDEKSIVIFIEDNGIGIAKAKTFSKSEHNLNMGIKITQKRLKLIGDRLKVDSYILSEDLIKEATNPGTKVKLLVPIFSEF